MSKKKFNLVRKATADGGKKNELHVPASMNPPQWKVEIWGESGNRVKNFHDLSADLKANRAVIVLTFDSGKEKYHSEDLEEVTYRVVNPHPKTKEEWKQMQNEALSDFLITKSSDLLDKSDEGAYSSDLKCTLKKEGKQINLLVEKADGTDSKIIKNLELKGKFYCKELIEEEDFVSFPAPPKTAWWKTTQAKITIGVILGIILLLIIIFRKKIWGWIKPEKKKPSETIIL